MAMKDATGKATYTDEYRDKKKGTYKGQSGVDIPKGNEWEKAYSEFAGVQGQSPDAVKLERYNLGGIQKAGVAEQGGTSLTIDPTLRAAQMAALGKMQGVMDTKGLGVEDKNRLSQINLQQAIAEQGQRQAIMQQAQARGQGSSGLALSALLGQQQAGAGSRALQGSQVLSDAAGRQRQAALDVQSMGANMQGQNFQAQTAQDLINQFNSQMKNQANQNYAALRNQAMLQNTDIGNQQTQWNTVGRQQQGFQNAMDLAAAKAGVWKAAGGANVAERGQTMGLIGTLGSAAIRS